MTCEALRAIRTHWSCAAPMNKAKADGMVTKKELARIQDAQNRASRNIGARRIIPQGSGIAKSNSVMVV